MSAHPHGPGHEQWSDAVGSYLLGALPDDEREAFEAHLAGCPACTRDVAELQVAADALPMSVPLVPPPAALKDRIMAVVNAEAELLAAAGARADEPPAPAPPARRPRRSFGSWFLRPGVALACGLVLLVCGGVAGVLLSGGSDTRTVVAETRATGADVRLEIGEDESRLVATNMPAPPQGRIYQVWLKRPGRDPEPTSVLWSTRADGSAEVAVPGSLDGVEAVLVTDEPEGGSDVPSKPPVITAETA
jgi:anti-sigma-K factor RskA